jgi:Tol biopolymer transport system component
MGGGAEGVPGMIDLAGNQTIFGSDRFWQHEPPAFNHDGSLLLVTYAKYGENVSESAFLVWDIDGNEVARIEHPAEGFYSEPRWSPVDNRIAFHASIDQTPNYAVYDLAAGRIIALAPSPRASDKVGGGCGGDDMWRTDWSRDGTHVLYGFTMGDTGANGVWAWDVATGEQRVVPASGAGPASPGPRQMFAFHSWGAQKPYIFIGDVRGGFPRLLAEGSSPAWTPQ